MLLANGHSLSPGVSQTGNLLLLSSCPVRTDCSVVRPINSAAVDVLSDATLSDFHAGSAAARSMTRSRLGKTRHREVRADSDACHAHPAPERAGLLVVSPGETNLRSSSASWRSSRNATVGPGRPQAACHSNLRLVDTHRGVVFLEGLDFPARRSYRLPRPLVVPESSRIARRAAAPQRGVLALAVRGRCLRELYRGASSLCLSDPFLAVPPGPVHAAWSGLISLHAVLPSMWSELDGNP